MSRKKRVISKNSPVQPLNGEDDESALAHRCFFWPFDEELIGRMEVNVCALEERLGIVTSAEKEWYDRALTSCFFDKDSSTMTPPELKALADTGDPFRQNDYAHLLGMFSSNVGEESFAYALASAKQSLPFAEVTVGWSLLHGLGVARDPVAAFEWNLKGARQGHPEGASNVAFQFQHGIGVAKNYEQAIAWYTYATIRGSIVAHGSRVQMKRDGY